MISDKQKHIIQLLIILSSIVLSSAFLSPFLNNSKEGSGLLGGLIGLVISIVVFPETSKKIFQEQSALRQERLNEERALGFWRFLTRPTQIPLTLSMLLFIASIILAVIFDYLKFENGYAILRGGLIGTTFLWGLSGVLMIIRNETIDKSGRRHRGFWAIFNGIGFLLFGWGSLIVLIFAEILNW
ncbi:MAG: hypothetical protein QY306_00405 [Anaerolineales bacterium]|nr:MAG: hypothetical protein QY306_00405 [Anaerolineales bacterium]